MGKLALTPYWKHLAKCNLVVLAFGVALGCADWIGVILGVRPGGTEIIYYVFHPGKVFLCVVAGISIIFGWPAFLVRSERGRTFRIFLSYCFTYLAAIALWSGANDAAELRGLQDFADRSMPLVNAIRKYEADHGQPPALLQALSPDYFDSDFHTGMALYPDFKYEVLNPSEQWNHSNTWQLSVEIDCGFMICGRELLYRPKEDYALDELMYVIEPYGRWAFYQSRS